MDPSDRAMLARLEEQIRELAYLLWEAEGRQHGRSLEHWLEAERQILTLQAAARRTDTVVEVVTATIDTIGGMDDDLGDRAAGAAVDEGSGDKR